MKKIAIVFVLAALACCTVVVKKYVDDLRGSEARCRYEREAEQADDTAFKQAASTFKIAELEKYLKDFPAGKHVVDATERIRELKDEEAKELVWSERFSKAGTWATAVGYCGDLKEGGHNDWRLPTIDELRTLIKNCPKTERGGSCKVSEKNACLADNCFSQDCYCGENEENGHYSKLSDGDGVWLWSSSSNSDDPERFWYVSFARGMVGSLVKEGYEGDDDSVRCVRIHKKY